MDRSAPDLPPELASWFRARGWQLRHHQREMLAVAETGRHALLVADTGAGKTLAGFLPTLADFCPSRLDGASPPEGLHALYVSPLKALNYDIERNLRGPLAGLRSELAVGVRTGDTPQRDRARMLRQPPDVLITRSGSGWPLVYR